MSHMSHFGRFMFQQFSCTQKYSDDIRKSVSLWPAREALLHDTLWLAVALRTMHTHVYTARVLVSLAYSYYLLACRDILLACRDMLLACRDKLP